MFREMISSGRGLPRIESHHDHVRVSLEGGRANTQVARFVAQLAEQERDDTDSMRRTNPAYRLRGHVLRELGAAVPYQRRTVDEMDRKVIAHVREYGKVTNRTVRNMLDVEVQRARGILKDMVDRRLLRKTSRAQRGPGVEYGPGSRFPAKGRARTGSR